MKPAGLKDRFKMKIKHVLLKRLTIKCLGEGDQFWQRWQPSGSDPKKDGRIISTSLRKNKYLFGEAQGEQLSEAAFPRTAPQLSAAGLL